jgi:uncharacterized protein (DUF779 family)
VPGSNIGGARRGGNNEKYPKTQRKTQSQRSREILLSSSIDAVASFTPIRSKRSGSCGGSSSSESTSRADYFRLGDDNDAVVGCMSGCDVPLYYPSYSSDRVTGLEPVHCTVVPMHRFAARFERKSFRIVLSTHI